MNATTKVFAAVWTDVFEQPKVKTFSTRQAAEDWAKGFSNVGIEECEAEKPCQVCNQVKEHCPSKGYCFDIQEPAPYSCDDPDICDDCNTEIILGRCNQCS